MVSNGNWRRAILQSPILGGGGKAAHLTGPTPDVHSDLPFSRGVLRAYGTARRSAENRQPITRDHPRLSTEHYPLQKPGTPRAFSIGPALGCGREDMSQTRRLAAILAADVAGYSRLMGADEEGTHERLKTLLSQLVDPKIKEHRGRTVKNTGDGMLVEF